MGALGEATHVQFVDHAVLPAVAGAGGCGEIEAIPLGHHALEAGGGVGYGPHRRAPFIPIPAADRPGTGIEQHLGGVEAVAAALQGAEHPVAVAAAQADPLHLHMPVVAGTVPPVQLDHLLGFSGAPIGEEQQLHPGGQGGHHREIHTGRGDRGAQGRGLSDPVRRQGPIELWGNASPQVLRRRCVARPFWKGVQGWSGCGGTGRASCLDGSP